MKKFIFLFILLPIQAMAFPHGGGAAPTIPIPAGAVAFYSAIRPTGWGGQAVNVKCSGSGATTDIGYDVLTNYVDTAAALTTFACATQIQLQKIYDTSGNGNDCIVGANNFASSSPGTMRAANAINGIPPIATMSQPNGGSGVAFCNFTGTLSSQNYTVAMVVSQNGGLFNSWGFFGLGNDSGTLFNNMTIYYSNNPAGKLSWTTLSNFPSAAQFPQASVPMVLSVRGTSSPTSVLRMNGTDNSNGTNGLVTFTGGQVGSGSWNSALMGASDFWAVALFNTAQSSGTLAALETQWYTSYKVPNIFTREVTEVGDSLTQGLSCAVFNVNQVRATYGLLNNPNNILMYNLGNNGDSAANIAGATRTAQVDAHYNGALASNMAINWSGTNDIDALTTGNIVGGETAIYTNLTNWTTGRNSTGFHTALGTIIPRQWSGSGTDQTQKEAVRLALNILIRNGAVANNYTTIDYAAAWPTASTYTTQANGFSCDSVHELPPGVALTAPYQAVFINAN